MNQRTTLLFLLAIIPMFWLSSPSAWSQENNVRKWTSHDGSESIEASLESFDKKTKVVLLRDQNGEEIAVKISLLSRADRRFVAKASKKKPSVFTKTKREPLDKVKTIKRSKESEVVERYGINWTVGLEDALASASSSEQRRPVMLFRVLGDLGGYM